jgi:uncharacterized protein YbjT (DUF2867 family)
MNDRERKNSPTDAPASVLFRARARGPKTVVVVGATGQQGGALVRLLLSRGVGVRAVTRRLDSKNASSLASLGATVVRADLDRNEGIEEALRGADTLFLVTTPFERGASAEVEQARKAGTWARELGVQHVVYSSVTKPMTFSPIRHFAAKGEAERLLGALGLPLTIVGAPPFADNLVAPWHLAKLRQGIFALPVPDAFPMQMVLTRDIAAVAAHVIEAPEAYVGARVDIATEAISGARMLAALERASGRSFERRILSFAELDPMLGELFQGVEFGGGAPGAPGDAPTGGAGPLVDIPALRRAMPSVRWSSIEAWIGEQDWSTLLGGEHGNHA